MTTIKNHLITGTILGLILPAITLVIIFQAGFSDTVNPEDFLRFTLSQNILQNLVSLSGIPNLALFFLFIKTSLYENAKGVILSTFVLVIIVIILKFFV